MHLYEFGLGHVLISAVSFKPFQPNNALLVTLYCTKGGTGKGEWGQLHCDMHMVAVVAGCKKALVGTGWANSCLGYTNVRLENIILTL